MPHILYIEDDTAMATLLQRRLERVGHTVSVARNGESGIGMFASGNFDILAIDQNLPDINGIEVLRRLLGVGRLPLTIMITGAGDEKTAVEALKLGAGDYLVKDVDGGYLELLPVVIDQLMERDQLIRERGEALESLQQHNEALALLNQIGQTLTSTLDIHQICDRLVNSVADLICAETSSVWLVDEIHNDDLVCYASAHATEQISPVGQRVPPNSGIVGWVAEHGEKVILPDVQADKRFYKGIDQQTGFNTNSVLAVPLRVRGKITGVLEVLNKRGDGFTEHDALLTETVAASAAIAIDNARLIQSLRQQTNDLQADNQALDAFARTTAHNLKTPLVAMSGYIDLLMGKYGEIDAEETETCLGELQDSAYLMSNIINEMLLLASLGKRDVQRTSLNMARIVEAALHRLEFMTNELVPNIIFPYTWPTAVGYAPWIEEVWVNYLSNALKYGGASPTLELGATCQPDGAICFWVKDSGKGLSPEQQAQLFSPFTQLDENHISGHGLGLSIVREIMEKLGGSVSVSSELGKGSTFSFILPSS